MRKDKETKIDIKWNILFFASLPEVQYHWNWIFVKKHTLVLPRVETSFYKPLGALVLYLFQQRVWDLYRALLQPACTFYINSVDDRVTYTCPQVDGCKHVLSSSRWMWSKCHWHIDSYSQALQTWVVGVLKLPLLPHKSCLVLTAQHTATDSLLSSVTLTKQQQFHTVCKFSLALARYIILTKNYPTNGRSLKAKFTVCALSFVLFLLSSRLGVGAFLTKFYFA